MLCMLNLCNHAGLIAASGMSCMYAATLLPAVSTLQLEHAGKLLGNPATHHTTMCYGAMTCPARF